MREDTDISLRSIRREIGCPIYLALLEIQTYNTAKAKSLEWFRRLQCLYVARNGREYRSSPSGNKWNNMQRRSKRLLGRTRIDPFDSGEYIAVSYVWTPVPGEDTKVGGYRVTPKDMSHPRTSVVRDIVWDRVTNFANYTRCRRFWVDQECIDQADEAEKEIAIHSMDLVYSHSEHPVALLSAACIVSGDELDLLAKLLSGSFIAANEDTAAPDLRLNACEVGSAERALDLLNSITSDPWWNRAWPFQEDYRASTKMTLLIRHHPSLEARKRGVKGLLFGKLEGELCVNSARFRREASRLCLAYRNKSQCQGTRHEEVVRLILQRAGKYTVTLQDRRADRMSAVRISMSPSIFSDVGAREAERCADRLAIVANCCAYSVCLDTKKLQESSHSLSLALLTLYLLNGEILMNGGTTTTTAVTAPLNDTIFDFLKGQSLNTFSPPIDQQQLTFIKSCRFIQVRLVEEGIRTRGHLWELGPTIRVDLWRRAPWQDNSESGLSWHQRRRLCQLLKELRFSGARMPYDCEDLATSLEEFLDEDADYSGNRELSFSRKFQTRMAAEVADALLHRAGKVLRLGRLVDTPGDTEHGYTGIFVCDSDRAGREQYIFTASWDGDGAEIDKHVTLEVGVRGRSRSGMPMLEVKRWINGFIFFRRCRRQSFIFPWPPSFTV